MADAQFPDTAICYDSGGLCRHLSPMYRLHRLPEASQINVVAQGWKQEVSYGGKTSLRDYCSTVNYPHKYVSDNMICHSPTSA